MIFKCILQHTISYPSSSEVIHTFYQYFFPFLVVHIYTIIHVHVDIDNIHVIFIG